MKSFITILSCMCWITSLCQVPDKEVVTSPPRSFIKMGIAGLHLQDLNSSLLQSGYVDIESIYTREYGMIFKRSGSRLGSTLAYIGLEASNNDHASFAPGSFLGQNRTLKGSGLTAGLDYYLVNNKRFKVYAPVSLQWTKMKLTTFQNIPFDFQFSNSNGVIENRFTAWKHAVEFGLNIEAGIPTKHVLFILGTNAGYRIDYGDNQWKYSDEISIGFPELRNQGWVWGFTLGMSGIPRVYNAPRRM